MSTAAAEPTVPLRGKALREAVATLDRSDPAVGFALSVRREGGLLLAGGSATLGIALGAAIGRAAVGGAESPYLASVGVAAGLGVMVAGLPAMITAPTMLGWYAVRGPAPSRLARLKLLRRWRLELLRVRRDTGLAASAFLGVAAILTAVTWGVRDGQGLNGVIGESYFHADAVTTASFGLVGGTTALAALISHLQFLREKRQPHRAFARGSLWVGPCLAAGSGGETPTSPGAQVRLSLRF